MSLQITSRTTLRAEPETGRASRRPWAVAAVATLAIVTASAFATMTGLLVEPLHDELGWSRSVTGVAASVTMLLYGLATPFAAALMDRFGMRRVAATALGVLAAGAAATTAVGAPWQLTAVWGVPAGLGTGALATGFAATVVSRWFAARRGLVTGLLTAAVVFGQFAFLPVNSWVVDSFSWRTALLVLAAAALAVAPLAWLGLRDHPADAGVRPYGAERFVPRPPVEAGAARRAVRVLREVARTTPFWLLAGTFAICGASTNGLMWTHFASAAHDHGMPTTVAASLLALIGVFNVAGTIAAGWLTDRYDPRRLLAVFYALRGLSLVVLPMLLAATVHTSLVVFVVVFGLLDNATVPPTLALTREFHGRDAAIVFGWVVAAHQVGAALIAFAGGAARDILGSYDAVWPATGGLCAVAALLAVVLRRPGRPRRPVRPTAAGQAAVGG